MRVTAILAAGGAGRRLGAGRPKQLLDLGGRSILERSVAAFTAHPRISEIVLALPADIAASPPDWIRHQPRVRVVAGGPRRQDSVANAFDAIGPAADVVLVHDAARPFVSGDVISRAIDAAGEHGAAIVAMPVTDTVKRAQPGSGRARRIVETLPRADIFLAQTPQAFRRDVLGAAIALGRSGVDATDEAALAEQAGHPVHIVEGDAANVKITTPDDLETARAHVENARQGVATTRVGTGYDLHRLVKGRTLVLGGVDVPFERGALGHSDADVICHAVTDAVLGAAGLGDIGRHFPDTDPRWKDAVSVDLLRDAVGLVAAAGYRIVNMDVVVILEQPKIAPFIERIRASVAGVLRVPRESVSVKGKTNEGMDAIGRGEAVAAHAVALLERVR
jgi:2-C-methyl-D-erythritol 4-phosphate cytidylyltransferase/2-C-methyl-D-erythritol 2,4-cyclodiphosphate synthase